MNIWTVGTAWYLFLPIYTDKKLTIQRETFYKYLKDLCDEAGITRAKAGIITGARAELYFDGEWSSVSLDNSENLLVKERKLGLWRNRVFQNFLENGPINMGLQWLTPGVN